jgi:alpha-D-xyloside xylohydrolase
LRYVLEVSNMFDLSYPPMGGEKFEYIEKAVKYSEESPGIFIFNCETNLGNKAKLRIDFCSPETFRVRMALDKIHEKGEHILVKDKISETNPRFEEKDGYFTLSTSRLILRIEKNPWQLRIFDVFGKLVSEEGWSKNVMGDYISPPIGFLEDQNGKRTAETMRLFPDEHIYGLGEKFTDLDRRGKVICSWNQDALGNSTPRTYKNIPFFMSTRGYSIFINSSREIVYDLGSRSFTSYSFFVKDEQLDYFFIYGPSFKEILDLYTELTGKAPVPPKWSFGLWMSRCAYKTSEEIEKVARGLRELDVPCDVVHLDPTWLRPHQECDLVWNHETFPGPKEMISKLLDMGFKLSLWINPYVPKGSELFREGEAHGFFAKKEDGPVYDKPLEPWDFYIFQNRGVIDFSNPEAVEWYKGKLRKFLELGVAVFKTDFGESAPRDAIYYGGVSGEEMHNLYPLLYNKAVFELTRDFYGKGLVWARSGYAGMQRFPTCWSGDPEPSFQTMPCTLRGGLSIGLSGVPFWSHDIGGFNGRPSPELYVRWAQFGLFSPHSRCHGTTPREPWEFGEEALRIFRYYAKLRYRLLPYIYSCAHISSRTGLPMIRAMVLEYQDDPNCYDKDTQYMFGESFLVAPIFNEEGERTVYLPAGRWIDYWTKEELEGPKNITCRAPLDRLPLFVRADSIIPMGPEMNYVGEKPFDPITLDIYLYDRAEFILYDDDEQVRFSGERRPKMITFEIGESCKSYALRFNNTPRPIRVRANGKDLACFSTREDLEGATEGWFFEPSGPVEVKLPPGGNVSVTLDL